MLVLVLPPVSGLWFSCGLAVSMGEAAKLVLLSCCQLWKLEEVSYEMLVFLHPRVLSRVAGSPVASPCLWGKLQNISFSKVSKQVVMSFCVAGVALRDIPTCLITCRKNLWFSRHVAVSVGKLQNISFSKVSKQVVMSLCVAGVALCDIPTLHSTLYTLQSILHALHFTFLTPHFTLHTPHSTLYTLHSTLYTPNFTF